MQDVTSLPYGRIFDIVIDGVRSGKLTTIGLSPKAKKGIQKKLIPAVFPYSKKITVREDTAQRLLEEAKFKAYTCRSFYAGALFQILIQRLGAKRLITYVANRPDLYEAIYG